MLIVKLAILERVFCPQKMVASTAFAMRFGGSVCPEIPWSVCPETVGQLAPKWCGLIHHNLHVDAEKEYRSYTVYEREEEPVPETNSNIREDLPPLAPGSFYIYPYNPNTDERQVSLKLIIESVGVYTINAVQIKAEAHSVQRHHFSFKELNDE
ncbi:hypothetical protein DIU31_023975 [Mucilaginibacter rubeus]|uniref:Uncharacterized protein n=1 Tax=Mucilaginibacter rubeus TaxID=2027860 RepID=A0AAE6JJ57_9SPHI|nr:MULTISPECIES: hypothetical protein [Mucilaginibacter]QEM06421.1 hypothetical protein DIU31_023975 [Mucilaginibacter rubeus]QEM19005.1 hypothetical protein DIU38_024205 [Mucilaginibacter gossypii]QTE44454.1 hypothetical protein J3L19_03500 [Mucilaginibacter rubeus]QTE51053.1 hypothetical protein J3L21_03475 [Mucilaginibacter rubeus]QTE56136.1 hypothetical protein J3L23_28715 [Mucilaginibacter rubeus]